MFDFLVTLTSKLAWALCMLTEAALMIRVWRRLRATYSSFFLYLLADLTAALFLAGVVYIVPWDYPVGFIALELMLVAFQAVVTVEAVRRAHRLLSFRIQSIPLILIAALLSTTLVWWLLRSPNPWPNYWLAPANAFRATIEMFLGLTLLFLVALPGRAPCLAKFQGRHLAILSIYLIVSSFLLFLENDLYARGSAIPGSIIMFITAGFFIAWTFLVPRRLEPAEA